MIGGPKLFNVLKKSERQAAFQATGEQQKEKPQRILHMNTFAHSELSKAVTFVRRKAVSLPQSIYICL